MHMESEDERPPPLKDLLVLDLTRAVAGPFCTMVLADLGSRVIKIENPRCGDETRQWGPFVEDESAYFLGLNRNKQSVALDLKCEEDLAAFRELAQHADVVVENFRPGVATRLGIGYEQLRENNRRLIYAAISGFGRTGPNRSKPAYDLIMQAICGMMRANAVPGGPPMKTCFPVADVLAGLFAGTAVLAALHKRETTGEGSYIDVSLLQSLLAAMSPVAQNHLLTGIDPGAMGGAMSTVVPYQMFHCQDRPIVVAVPNDGIWRRFCEALGKQRWCDEGCYRDNAARSAHRAKLESEIAEVLGAEPASHWLGRLDAYRIPCAPILSVSEAFRDGHIREHLAVTEVRHDILGTIRLVRSPMMIDDTTWETNPPPALGQHTAAVLKEFRADREKALVGDDND